MSTKKTVPASSPSDKANQTNQATHAKQANVSYYAHHGKETCVATRDMRHKQANDNRKAN
jgi:hypothetical protein